MLNGAPSPVGPRVPPTTQDVDAEAATVAGEPSTLGAANGGEQAVRDWSRLFPVPGMGHCRGGEATLDEFDLLSSLVDWCR